MGWFSTPEEETTGGTNAGPPTTLLDVPADSVATPPAPGALHQSPPHAERTDPNVAPNMDTSSLKNYVLSKRNKNTVQKTDQNFKRFEEYMENMKNEHRPIIKIPVETMDNYIGGFMLSVKKRDGGFYEPDSLTAFHRSIARKLKEIDYPHDVIVDAVFSTSRQVLAARRRELKQMGLGNKPNRASSLSVDEENILWESGALSCENPTSLMRALWFLLTKMLGFRGSHESRQLKWGDLVMVGDGAYIEFNERETKTRMGQDGSSRQFKPKLFPNKAKPSQCPVKLYQVYASKRPESRMDRGDPFYLTPNHMWQTAGMWFKTQPIGHDKLGKMMSDIAKSAGLEGHYTNHSVRKTMCTQLVQAGVPPTIIQQLSGHKNVQSLNNYATASIEQQMGMSSILQRPSHYLQSASIAGTSGSGDMYGLRPQLDTDQPRPLTLQAPAPFINSQDSAPITPVQQGSQGTCTAAHNQQMVRSVMSGQFCGATFNGPVNISFH